MPEKVRQIAKFCNLTGVSTTTTKREEYKHKDSKSKSDHGIELVKICTGQIGDAKKWLAFECCNLRGSFSGACAVKREHQHGGRKTGVQMEPGSR